VPKANGSPTKGEVTSEQLKATKAELTRMAQQLELERERLSEKLAAASLAEQIRAIRTEKQQERKKSGEKLPAHRPSDYTEEAAASLLQWITEGKSLRSWCRQASVSPMAVYQWMARQRDFADRYARAYDNRADTLADEILDIADETAGTESIAAVQAAKLRIETRKWIASKLKPQQWGDRQVVEQTGTVTFSLGIPSRTPPPVTIEGSAFEIRGLPDRLADCESDSRPPASPSPVVSSSPTGEKPAGGTP